MINNILTIHNEAMDLASLGDAERRKGNNQKAIEYYNEAYEKELQAAMMTDSTNSNDVGQAVLLRSAATLATQCGRGHEAEPLIDIALRKDIPEFLTEQLRALLKEIASSDIKAEEDTETVGICIPRKDRSFLSSLINRMGWKLSLPGKVSVL